MKPAAQALMNDPDAHPDFIRAVTEAGDELIVYGEPIGAATVPDNAGTERERIARDIANAITTYWVPPSDAYVLLLTTAIIATWNQDAFEIAIYIRIKGDSVGAKGVVERVLVHLAYPGRLPDGTLAPRARRYLIPTPAPMFHTIERYDRPTMIFCEAGKWLSEATGKFDKYEDIKAMVQEGFAPDAIVPRMANGNSELKDYNVFCPKVLSGTGTLVHEIENRCIPILTQEVVKARHHARKYRQKQAAKLFQPVRDAIAALSTSEYTDELRRLEEALYDEPGTPRIPDIGNRVDDMCTPLIAVADSISEEWGHNVREAITEVMGMSDDTPAVPLDRQFLDCLMHAMRQKYVAATSRAEGRNSKPIKSPTGIGGMKNDDFGHPIAKHGRQPFKDFSLEIAPDKQQAHLYVQRDKKRNAWKELHSYVSRANGGNIADADTVLAALDDSGRLTRYKSDRNLGVPLPVWKGTNNGNDRCLKIDVSDLFEWESTDD